MSDVVVVTGGGGFIGGHLVRDLVGQGLRVRAVDMKPLDAWYQVSPDAESVVLDLCERQACEQAVAGASRVFNLAADMGGMGFIENNKALCMLSVLINTHMLMASREAGVDRFFFSSSACVYAADKQDLARCDGAGRGRRLPGDARGRLRVGEALQRADVPALPGGLRSPDPGRALPQRLRSLWDVRRRPREGARRHLPQGHRGQALGLERDRDLGRRRADPELHVRRRLRLRHPATCWTATSSSRSTSAAPSSSRSTSSSTSSRRSPASSSSATTSSTRPRACAGATATTPSSSSGWAGSRRSACATGWSRPTGGSTTRWPPPARLRRAPPRASTSRDRFRSRARSADPRPPP